MQREIKFSVWSTKDKKFLKETDIDDPDRLTVVSTDRGFRFRTPEENGGYIHLQYTGLKDKNSKEIYERDILSNDAGAPRMEVIFNQGCWTLNGLENLISDKVDHTRFLEVIGNIYENPELLK